MSEKTKVYIVEGYTSPEERSWIESIWYNEKQANKSISQLYRLGITGTYTVHEWDIEDAEETRPKGVF